MRESQELPGPPHAHTLRLVRWTQSRSDDVRLISGDTALGVGRTTTGCGADFQVCCIAGFQYAGRSTRCRLVQSLSRRASRSAPVLWRLAGGKPCAAPGGEPQTNCAPAGAPESLQSTLTALSWCRLAIARKHGTAHRRLEFGACPAPQGPTCGIAGFITHFLTCASKAGYQSALLAHCAGRFAQVWLENCRGGPYFGGDEQL